MKRIKKNEVQKVYLCIKAKEFSVNPSSPVFTDRKKMLCKVQKKKITVSKGDAVMA